MANKIRCSHILLKKQSEALNILLQIKKGEKFGKLARCNSLCCSKRKDGNFAQRRC